MTSTPTTPLPVHNGNVTVRRRYADLTAPPDQEDLLAGACDAELASPPRKRVREPVRNVSGPSADSADSGTVPVTAPRSADQSTNTICSAPRPIRAANTTTINLPSLPPMLLFSSCPIPSTASKFATPAQRKLTSKLTAETPPTPSGVSVRQCSANAIKPDGFVIPPSADESPARNLRPRSPSKSPQKTQPRLFPSVGSLLASSKDASPLNSTAGLATNLVNPKPLMSTLRASSQLPAVRRFKAPRSAARLNVSLSWKAGTSHNVHSDESVKSITKPDRPIICFSEWFGCNKTLAAAAVMPELQELKHNTEMTTSSSSSSTTTTTVNAKLRPPTRSQRRRVSFGRLQVYYFDRAQGFDTMPAAGSIALGMEQRHHTMKEYSFFEFIKANSLEQTQKCARWLTAANAEIRERSAASSRGGSRLASPGSTTPQTSSSAESSASNGRLNADFAAALAVDKAVTVSPIEQSFPSISQTSSLAAVEEEEEEVDCLATATSSSDVSNSSMTDALNNNNLDKAVKQPVPTNMKNMVSLEGAATECFSHTGDMARLDDTPTESPAQLAAIASAVGSDAANFFAQLQSQLNADPGSKPMANDGGDEGGGHQAPSGDVPNLDETVPYCFDGGSSDGGFTLPSFLAGLSAAGIKFNVAECDEDDDDEEVADTPPRSPTSSTYSSDEDVTDEFKQLEGQFLPIRSRIRRTILRQAGVDIDTSIRDEYLAIARSRSDVGCDCVGECQPATCACARLGVGCQVDRPPFPCGCDVSCSNPEGRVEYDPHRVHSHYLHTIMRLKTIQKRGLEDSPLSVSPQRIKFADDDKGGNQPSPLTAPAAVEAESSDA